MASKTTYSVMEFLSNNERFQSLKSSDSVDSLVPNTRMPALILMDTSGSMDESKKLMEDAIVDLYDKLLKNNYSRSSAELGIMAFNEIIDILEPMREITSHTKKGKDLGIRCQFQTLTGLALAAALDHLEKRINVYKDNYMSYYSPILFFFSDGVPYSTDPDVAEEDREALDKVLHKIKELVDKNLLVVIAYEIGDSCDHSLMCKITGLDNEKHVRKVLSASDMTELFEITSSMIISASKRGTLDTNSLSIDEILNR